jgi:endonuclease/exonuclease/phosphatase family metal-dependent hydrolase
MGFDLRVVTLNTGKCDGPYTLRLEALARGLRALQPDVIALQECFASSDKHFSTARMLGDELGMQYTFAAARRKPRQVEGTTLLGDSGLCLLTRWPLLRSASVALPEHALDGERIAQFGVLPCGSCEVLLANLHLCHLRDAGTVRRAEIDSILAHPWLHQERAARLLLGDFNATVDSPELMPLLNGTLGWNVLDTYAAGNGREPRATVSCQAGWWPARRQDRCIDFILSLADTPLSHPRFRTSAVVLNQPDGETGTYASDHFGVATTMML